VDRDGAVFAVVGSGIAFIAGDLNGELPYPPAFFDLIVCVEGIEHLENPSHLLRSFARILKPGGRLIITTPNITSFASRIKFMLFGSYRYFNSRVDIADRSLAGHIHPIWFPGLEHALAGAGFEIETVTSNYRSGNGTPAARCIAGLWKRMSARFNKAHNPYLCSPALLFGDILIVSSRKGSR